MHPLLFLLLWWRFPVAVTLIGLSIFTLLYLVMSVILIVLLVRLARQPLPKREWEVVTALDPAAESTVVSQGG